MSPELKNGNGNHEPKREVARGIAAQLVASEVEVQPDPSVVLLADIQHERPEIEIRDYQIDCLNVIANCRTRGDKMALIHMATGLGKTTVAAADAKRFVEENPQARILFLCHQNQILRQARQRFEAILGTEKHTFGDFTGVSKDMHAVTCLFASFQTMKDWRQYFSPDEFDYVIVDEGHHSKAETYEPTLKYFNPKFLLGMTATPDRQDLKEIREIFGHEEYSKNLAKALAEGLLARPDYRVILDDIQQDILRGVLERENVSLAEINRTVFIPKRDEEIARIIQERTAAIERPKIIVFCPSIDHSQRVANLLPNSAPFHSGMKRDERDEALEAFRKDQLQSLITVDMFNEGMDIADANVIVFLRSTQSETIFLQQLGRGLRKLPDKDSVLVLDFVANCDRLIMIEKLLHDAVRNIPQVRRYEPEAVEVLEEESDEEVEDFIDLYGLDFKTLEEDLETMHELGIGSFEFTESTRKILDIVKRISAGYVPAREGWSYVGRVAEDLGTSRKTVLELARALGMDGVRMQGTTGRVGMYFSDEQIRLISESLGSVPPAPESWLAVRGMQNKYGLNPYTTNTITQKLAIEGTLMKSRRGQKGIFFSPEEQELIVEEAMSLEAATDEWLSASAIAERSPVSLPKVQRAIEDLGLSGRKMKNKQGHEVTFYSPEEQTLIMDNIAETIGSIPEGWLSPALINKEYGVHSRTVVKIANSLGIPGTRMRNRLGNEGTYYSPDEVRTILDNVPEKDDTPEVPEGYLSVLDIEKQAGLSDTTVLKYASELELEWEVFRNRRGKVVRFLSPDKVERLLNHPNLKLETAPDGYLSIRGASAEFGVAESTIKSALGKLEVTLTPYRDPRSNNVFSFMSPEQADKVRNLIKQNPRVRLREESP